MGQALDFASKAVAIDPENVVALRALSAVQYHLGNFDESNASSVRRWRSIRTTPIRWRSLAGGLPFAAAGMRARLLRARDRADHNPPGLVLRYDTIHLYLEGRYREMLASAEHSAAGDPRGGAPRHRPRGIGNRAAAQEALARWRSRRQRLTPIPPPSSAAYHPLDNTVDAFMAGLRKAGWTEPGGSAGSHGD